MSEPTAGEVLGMLAEWREAVNAYVSTNDLDSESAAYRRMLSAEAVMDQLDPAHLRTLAAALTAPAPAEAPRTRADVERDLRRWLLEGRTGMSSEAIAYAYLGEPVLHCLPPADSGDFGRCLRLTHRIPEARAGVKELAALNPGWAYLDGIWERLTELAEAGGMLERDCGNAEIDRLIRARPRG